MKRPDSTEIDRLLRRYARRNSETLLAGREQMGDGQDASNPTHLDADELNAYAEGALPESARSRYFAHLADCDTCRRLVTDLTLAASIADEGKAHVPTINPSPSKSWRDWLAAIFSPPVLRYGVPALAMFALIVVAIVATRTRRESSFVAQKNEAARAYTPSAMSNSNSSAETTTTDTIAENHSNSNMSSSNTASPVQPQNPTVQSTPAATGAPAQENNGTIVADAPVVNQPNTAKSAEGQAGGNSKQPVPEETARNMDETVTVTSTPSPAPVLAAPTAAAEADNKDKREERKRAQVAGKDDDVSLSTNGVGGVARTQTEVNGARDVTGRRAARSAQNLPSTKPAAPPKSEAADKLTDKERPAETRSSNGHKFRRQGSAWVDIEYNSSLSTINIARGSEQYRALIADEPGLRKITQQLGGEVIVVWKGRAYRFY
jgi:hypothetical protein